jgi:hypothetical protein
MFKWKGLLSFIEQEREYETTITHTIRIKKKKGRKKEEIKWWKKIARTVKENVVKV